MEEINFTEYKTDLDHYFNYVESNNEALIIKRENGKSAVMISSEEYYSIKETLQQLGDRTNAERLFESIEQIKACNI